MLLNWRQKGFKKDETHRRSSSIPLHPYLCSLYYFVCNGKCNEGKNLWDGLPWQLKTIDLLIVCMSHNFAENHSSYQGRSGYIAGFTFLVLFKMKIVGYPVNVTMHLAEVHRTKSLGRGRLLFINWPKWKPIIRTGQCTRDVLKWN